MSDHEHVFIWFHGRYECEECCRSEEAIKLEQQLAEAQDEIRQLRANPIPDLYKAQYALILDERDTYRQELAEAQAKIARQEEELRIVAAQRQDYKAQLTTLTQESATLQRLLDEEYKKTNEARALLEEAMHVIVGAASPAIPNEIARFEFWRMWGERVRAFLHKQSG